MSTALFTNEPNVGLIIREREPLILSTRSTNSRSSSRPTTSSTSAVTSRLPCSIVTTTISRSTVQ